MFSINWIDSRRTVINLDFRKPEYVSSFPTKDRLKSDSLTPPFLRRRVEHQLTRMWC
jgi:hypothetical protein